MSGYGQKRRSNGSDRLGKVREEKEYAIINGFDGVWTVRLPRYGCLFCLHFYLFFIFFFFFLEGQTCALFLFDDMERTRSQIQGLEHVAIDGCARVVAKRDFYVKR